MMLAVGGFVMDKVTRTFEKIDRIQDMTTASFLSVSPPDEEEERDPSKVIMAPDRNATVCLSDRAAETWLKMPSNC